MQKVKLNRISKEPVIREIPDNCTAFIDMRARLTFQKMYDPLDKRWKTPVAQYFVFWTKNEKGEWVLHNEPLEELIRMGYLKDKGFQESILHAQTEGMNAPVTVGLNKISDDLWECPKCGNSFAQLWKKPDGQYIRCYQCGHTEDI